MGENETLKFYIVADEYIEYLSQFDNHVSWNKENKRPYIGIVLKIENHLYFAPLYSYKASYNKYKDNPSFIRIENRKKENVSIIRFAEMIPVPLNAIQLLDFNARGKKYKDLLQAESDFINDNKEIIYSKAKKIYRNVVKLKIPFFTNISCNFVLLEKKSKLYTNAEDREEVNINNTEITCEVFEELDSIKQKLESNNFNYVEEFTLDDIYMCNPKTKQYVPQNGNITDTLIIRYTNDDDKQIISKKRAYNSEGFEIGTEKTILKIDDINNAEKLLNNLGFTRFLRMIDKNYRYENENYIVFIQVIDHLGIFLEIETKKENPDEKEIKNLIELVKSFKLKTGTKYDIRKAELWYKKQQNT